MAAAKTERRYRPTESKYKGGASEMYVTYDIQQKTRGGESADYPKVKRVYIAGDVTDYKIGEVEKRTGRRVRGVDITYRQTRSGFRARRGDTTYHTEPSAQKFHKIVDVPEKARNVRFVRNKSRLPARYRRALQDIR